MGLGWEKACGAGKVGGQPSLWTIGPAHQVPLRSLSVTLQIAPGRAGRPPPHPRFRARRGRGGEDVPFAGFCSDCFWSLQHRLQEVLPESSLPHAFSKHLLSVQVLETHLSQPPLPRLLGNRERLILHLFLGGQKTKQTGKEGGGSSWEKLDCFAHSRLPTPPPRRPSGHEYPWESESAAGPCCHPQPDPVGGKADQRGHCSQS